MYMKISVDFPLSMGVSQLVMLFLDCPVQVIVFIQLLVFIGTYHWETSYIDLINL